MGSSEGASDPFGRTGDISGSVKLQRQTYNDALEAYVEASYMPHIQRKELPIPEHTVLHQYKEAYEMAKSHMSLSPGYPISTED